MENSIESGQNGGRTEGKARTSESTFKDPFSGNCAELALHNFISRVIKAMPALPNSRRVRRTLALCVAGRLWLPFQEQIGYDGKQDIPNFHQVVHDEFAAFLKFISSPPTVQAHLLVHACSTTGIEEALTDRSADGTATPCTEPHSVSTPEPPHSMNGPEALSDSVQLSVQLSSEAMAEHDNSAGTCPLHHDDRAKLFPSTADAHSTPGIEVAGKDRPADCSAAQCSEPHTPEPPHSTCGQAEPDETEQLSLQLTSEGMTEHDTSAGTSPLHQDDRTKSIPSTELALRSKTSLAQSTQSATALTLETPLLMTTETKPRDHPILAEETRQATMRGTAEPESQPSVPMPSQSHFPALNKWPNIRRRTLPPSFWRLSPYPPWRDMLPPHGRCGGPTTWSPQRG